MSKVSVIVITYNHQNFIQEAILSIMEQKTSFDFDVLIFDDCSIDNTCGIIENLINGLSNYKLIRSSVNVGATKLLTKALGEVRTEYIAYLEGDDYWIDTHKLQKQYEFLLKNVDNVACFTGFIKISKDNLIEYSYKHKYLNISDFVEDKETKTMMVSLFMRNIFNDENLTRLENLYNGCRIVGDKQLKCLLLTNGPIAVLPDITACYRFQSGLEAWSSNRNKLKVSIERFNVWNNIYLILANCNNSIQTKKDFYAMKTALLYFRVGKIRESIAYYRKVSNKIKALLLFLRRKNE